MVIDMITIKFKNQVEMLEWFIENLSGIVDPPKDTRSDAFTINGRVRKLLKELKDMRDEIYMIEDMNSMLEEDAYRHEGA